MNTKLVIKILAYAALVALVGFILFGSFQYYFRKKSPTIQNFLPESKPTFNTNNMEYHWALGPYIELRTKNLKEAEWIFGGRLEYRF